jgi:hypothetical protein
VFSCEKNNFWRKSTENVQILTHEKEKMRRMLKKKGRADPSGGGYQGLELALPYALA